MRVQDLMSHPAVTCHVNDQLAIAAHLMWEHDCGAIVVVRDDGKLAGVITDRDICMAALLQGRRLDEILVNSAMSQHTVTVRPDQPLEEAERCMIEHQIRRLPVIDAEQKPVGILSLNDVALESVQPDTRMANAAERVARALAAVSQRRASTPAAA